MRRIERMIYSVLILVLTVFAMIQWRRASFFATDNEEMQLQIEALEAEVRASEQLVEVAEGSSAIARSNALEMLKLRNEVAELREEKNKAERLGAELEKMRAEMAQTAVSNVGGFRGVTSGEVFPKEQGAAP